MPLPVLDPTRGEIYEATITLQGVERTVRWQPVPTSINFYRLVYELVPFPAKERRAMNTWIRLAGHSVPGSRIAKDYAIRNALSAIAKDMGIDGF